VSGPAAGSPQEDRRPRQSQFPRRGGGIDRVDRVDGVRAADGCRGLVERHPHGLAAVLGRRALPGVVAEEAARVLEISHETAKRDGRMAKALLLAQLFEAPPRVIRFPDTSLAHHSFTLPPMSSVPCAPRPR